MASASMTLSVVSLSLLSSPLPSSVSSGSAPFSGKSALALRVQKQAGSGYSRGRVVNVSGDVSAEGTQYLIIGAIAIGLIGTAFPILYSRKDLCPECDGAGFIRASGGVLSVNAARKDEKQIVCPRCKGLGKLGQVDK
eukprot:TRINITY_DN141_c0_g1_i2.p1 TRINITY_DN141_c0_g1~~TRINITY_DN141_c0_g1_i2.p1  ORF type:complete len:138 (+),score=22.28 TRINITY_DN141_c0_g1_i2:106-519(+)